MDTAVFNGRGIGGNSGGSKMNELVVVVLSAFVICWLALVGLLWRGRLPMDHPNTRSLHATPTPRIGGLGNMVGVAAATVRLASVSLAPVMLAAFALAALSVLDDVRGLPVALRFLAHFIAAVTALLSLGLGGWSLLLGTLAVVWMTNLYNFMDGADGLAVIGFSALALAAWLGDAPGLAAFCAAIAAAALAFLRFSFPRARVFIGDAGHSGGRCSMHGRGWNVHVDRMIDQLSCMETTA